MKWIFEYLSELDIWIFALTRYINIQIITILSVIRVLRVLPSIASIDIRSCYINLQYVKRQIGTTFLLVVIIRNSVILSCFLAWMELLSHNKITRTGLIRSLNTKTQNCSSSNDGTCFLQGDHKMLHGHCQDFNINLRQFYYFKK